MRRIIPLLLAVALGLCACQERKNEARDNRDNCIDSLQSVITQKDNEVNDLLGTFNEIQEGLRQISEAENRVTIVKDGENTNKNQQMRNDIQFIAERMQSNRALISKLRQQMRESSLNASQLQKTIDALVKEMDEKEIELQRLREELNIKDMKIADLDETVSSLSANVSELKAETTQQSQTITAQDKMINTAWYVFGTKKELKDQHIMENDRVLQANFNKSYFTKIDIRIDKEIKFFSKSARLLTNHPQGSYALQQDANMQYVLRITNPEAFWSTSKYLVVLVK